LQCFNSRGWISAALGAQRDVSRIEKFGVVVLPWPDRKKKANRTGPAVFAIKRSAHAAGRRRTGRPPSPSLTAALEGILVPDLALAWPRPGIEHGKPQEAATGVVDDSRVAERSARLGRSPPQAVDETPFDRNGASSRGEIIAESPAQFQETFHCISATLFNSRG
jgi:hypothetical protein